MQFALFFAIFALSGAYADSLSATSANCRDFGGLWPLCRKVAPRKTLDQEDVHFLAVKEVCCVLASEMTTEYTRPLIPAFCADAATLVEADVAGTADRVSNLAHGPVPSISMTWNRIVLSLQTSCGDEANFMALIKQGDKILEQGNAIKLDTAKLEGIEETLGEMEITLKDVATLFKMVKYASVSVEAGMFIYAVWALYQSSTTPCPVLSLLVSVGISVLSFFFSDWKTFTLSCVPALVLASVVSRWCVRYARGTLEPAQTGHTNVSTISVSQDAVAVAEDQFYGAIADPQIANAQAHNVEFILMNLAKVPGTFVNSIVKSIKGIDSGAGFVNKDYARLMAPEVAQFKARNRPHTRSQGPLN